MAAIDKIYAKKEQREELYAWCEVNKPEALRYFYDWYSPEWDDGLEHPITNFPEEIDMWLITNCPLSWVVAYIKDQYGIEAA